MGRGSISTRISVCIYSQLTVARVVPWADQSKEIGSLLEAIRLLRGEPIEFTLAGDIQVAIPADLRDDPRVKWFGSVPQERTNEFYRDVDPFAFPTLSDGFGLTQLEAQAWALRSSPPGSA